VRVLPSLVLAFAAALTAQNRQLPAVQSIPTLDLARYAGRWHEVAKFPNRFQKECVRETVADYVLLPEGDVRVVNSCVTASGSVKRAEGRARLARPGGPASQLKVRFAPRFLSWLSAVWGDYWVLDLTEDYSAALVGSPDRKYLWILSRTPQLDAAVRERLERAAAAQGFDVALLERPR
jgi:apolipoprotein D and lipocalin family protein